MERLRAHGAGCAVHRGPGRRRSVRRCRPVHRIRHFAGGRSVPLHVRLAPLTRCVSPSVSVSVYAAFLSFVFKSVCRCCLALCRCFCPFVRLCLCPPLSVCLLSFVLRLYLYVAAVDRSSRLSLSPSVSLSLPLSWGYLPTRCCLSQHCVFVSGLGPVSPLS